MVDYWTDQYAKKNEKESTSFATFVQDGKGYRVDKKLQTICIGDVKEKGKQDVGK